MLLCRIISMFYLLCSFAPASLLGKNISQENIGATTNKVEKLGNVTKLSPEFDSHDLFINNSTECHLEDSGITYESSNFSLTDDLLLEDEIFGHVIEKFIDEMKVFWNEVKSHLLEQKYAVPQGKWWHEGPESKYKAMKDKFYKDIPENLPQKIMDIISEYEMRYNDLMLSEIENDPNLLNKFNIEQDFKDHVSKHCTQLKMNELANEEQNEAKDSMNNSKCKKRSIEDIFEMKMSKPRSLPTINYDD